MSLDSDGFLLDPDGTSILSRYSNTEAVSFETLLTVPCLVLLGEPGIGKSSALADAVAAAQRAAEGSTSRVLRRNLAAYSSDGTLLEKVFGSDEFKDWRDGECDLHLLLDSLDECRLSVASVAKLLAEEISDLKSVDRLFLRIACRTAEWPESLTRCFQGKWPGVATRILELTPLTRAQVEMAVREEGYDAEAFVHAVIAKDLVGFARSPITLRFLLQAWRGGGGSLPSRLQEIYEAGCRELCLDPNDRSRDPNREAVPIAHRIPIASHIAAAAIFGGRTAIWTNSSEIDRPDNTLSLSELAQGSVTTGHVPVDVTETKLRVVLDSGLFTSRGPNLLGWAHQTYAEFLAARYLNTEGLNPAQILDLVASPVDADKKLVPQLQETAAWAAEPGTPLFKHLLRVQPDALLGSDVATAGSELKAVLLQAILDAFSRDDVNTDWWTLHRRWHKLAHLGVATTLRPLLEGRTAKTNTREIAIAIAVACKTGELTPALSRIALDPTETSELRMHAANAVVELGDRESVGTLRPLALGQAGPDPDHHLRGIALKACWPTHLTAEEMFGALVPKVEFTTGTYRSFLAGEWVSELTKNDLLPALAWVTNTQNEHGAGYEPFEGLEHRILDATVPYLNDDRILRSLVRAILSHLRHDDDLSRHGDSPLANRVAMDVELRQRMAAIALGMLPTPAEEAWLLTFGRMRLVRSEDIDWLLHGLVNTPDGPLRNGFAILAQRLLNPNDPSQVCALLVAFEADPGLTELVPRFLKPVLLDSEFARDSRRFHDQQMEIDRAQEALNKPISPTRSERITCALARLEAGEVDAWCEVCHILQHDERGRFDSSGYTWDLRDLGGWQAVSGDDEPRLVHAAERYLRERTAQPESWFAGTENAPPFVLAALHALGFLAGIAPEKLRALPVDVWIEWMPAILRFSDSGKPEQSLRMVAEAFRRVPSDAERWTVKGLEAAMAANDGLGLLDSVPETISPALSQDLLSIAQRDGLKPQYFQRLVRELWKRHIPGLREWLSDCLKSPCAIEAAHAERTVGICAVLVRQGGKDEWPLVREVIRRSDALGRRVFAEIVHVNWRTIPRILSESPEQESAELWEWGMKHFPPSEYQRHHGGGKVTDSEQIADFRDQLVCWLAEVGTQAACQALSRLAEAHPDLLWIAQLQRRASASLRKNQWIPVDPQVLFQMPRNRRGRLVQSEAQLLEVIIESLERSQECLQGVNPLARLFWNDETPKKEDEVTDWITQHLRRELSDRGVVLDREVVIKPTDRLDILVTAQAYDAKEGRFQPLSVIIEIKRDVNPGLDHSMETQLTQRYLTDNHCQTGLYLVAWFNKGRLRRSEAREGLDAHRQRLADQASALSSPERRIWSCILDFSVLGPSISKKKSSSTKRAKE
jgi:hypothetical protein